MDNKLPHLSEHVVAVVPHGIEAQHLTVHVDELPQFVKVRGCLEGSRGGCLPSSLNVRVGGHLLKGLRGVDLKTLTLEEVLKMD